MKTSVLSFFSLSFSLSLSLFRATVVVVVVVVVVVAVVAFGRPWFGEPVAGNAGEIRNEVTRPAFLTRIAKHST